ncbi:flagellar basal-body MS-ring/collar protein FliF [Caldalkalibacillus mannanilyticus]|uniref:flagellar basal-body MS-ring/collar protein FliF n=1 Tax=Caldalkalibacillus mannanilyticus TaxID=1418 RepID=UPI0004687EA1|nr:flagellar basal-body MS-ring/collar protein FliF [Caldalkalibacillus mannanilyticus]
MKDQMLQYKNQIKETWDSLSKKNKLMIIGTFIILSVTLALFIHWASKPEYVPIYTNLKPAEAGEIVSTIEATGVPVQLSPDGTSVSVPKAHAAKLKVDLAHAGIPRSGNINYGIFSENMGFGMTDKQFDVVERDAMQNELRYLIEEMDGIYSANVMITLPKESLWVADGDQTATASVVLSLQPGLELDPTKVKGLYHLISKSVPSLPVENIVIMDQNMYPLEYVNDSGLDSSLTVHQQNRQIKKDIEKDIQRELQQFLGRILGMDRVIVSVFATVDFSKEKREENLVEAIDKENNEGIAISIERIQESFSGEGTSMDGVPGTGETDIAGYPGANGAQNSEYEKTEERINREVNRIFRQIEASPFMINDLAISVGVDPPEGVEIDEVKGEIETILRNVVQTSLSANGVIPENLEEKITVFANEFKGRPVIEDPQASISQLLLYGVGALALLAIAGVAFALIRKSRRKEDEELEEVVSQPVAPMQDFDFDQDNPEKAKRKRIERLAQNKPDEFAKLLRTWIAEE